MNTEYSKLTPLSLWVSFENICDEYRLRLCKQFGISYSDTYWIVDRIGGELDINEFYVIGMDELRYIVDSSMTFEERYKQWTDTDNKNIINIRSWMTVERPEMFDGK